MGVAKFGDLGLLNGLVLLRIAVPLALVHRVIRLKLQILLIDDKERLPRRSSSTGKFLSHLGEQPHCVCVPIELQILYYAREASQWSYEPFAFSTAGMGTSGAGSDENIPVSRASQGSNRASRGVPKTKLDIAQIAKVWLFMAILRVAKSTMMLLEFDSSSPTSP